MGNCFSCFRGSRDKTLSSIDVSVNIDKKRNRRSNQLKKVDIATPDVTGQPGSINPAPSKRTSNISLLQRVDSVRSEHERCLLSFKTESTCQTYSFLDDRSLLSCFFQVEYDNLSPGASNLQEKRKEEVASRAPAQKVENQEPVAIGEEEQKMQEDSSELLATNYDDFAVSDIDEANKLLVDLDTIESLADSLKTNSDKVEGRRITKKLLIEHI